MKYYFKIFLLSVGIGVVNILMYLFLLQFQIVQNSSYVPQEAFDIFLILVAIPVQFLILALVAYVSKKNKQTVLMTSGLFVIACLLLILINTNEERSTFNKEQVYRSTEKYDYQQGIATPEGYPIKLLSNSEFTLAVKGHRNPYTLLETSKVYSTNWGNAESTFKSSEDGDVVLPDSLKLYWFSFLENKYYGLRTKLDKTKISNYFKKGYPRDMSGNLDRMITADYQDLNAGIAPGGDVILWISGASETREISVFKAKEMNINQFKAEDIVQADEIKKVLSDTCKCKDDLQQRRIVHNNQKIPFGIWTNQYREKYNWKVDLGKIRPTKSELEFYFYNGENFSFFDEEVIKSRHQNQVVPSYIIFHFFNNKDEYKAFFQFDEEEIYNNFKTLTKENRNEPLDIVLNFNEDFTTATVKIKSKNKTLDFTKMKTLQIRKD
ncbi:DUF2931 family protein [Epilithonimonas lactis]|uniref:DUF2931 family protein n=1 Tax=Epilithonimonas lactis TaxID=421072 RepID=A0A085BMY2_9FLAO|nr:DUF2931 family protein [Epilithonimonas lactis]KFC23827.1 hypothetical protein IO89_04470 [Epilithonimonas lactis]SEQ26721.1 Protein of unknown function [Epilithonimonas lactis]